METGGAQKQALKIGFYLEGMAGPGSGTWTRFKSLAIGLRDAGVQVYVQSPKSYSDDVDQLKLTSNSVIPDRSKFMRFLYRKKALEAFASEFDLDLVHIEAPPFVGIKNSLTVASIHDLRHFHKSFRTYRTLEEIYQRCVLPRQAHSLSLIATLSDWASRDIALQLKFDPNRILKLPPIVSNPDYTLSIPKSGNCSRRFALVLGHLEHRKNVETAILALRNNAWPSDVDLVIAGRNNGAESKLKALADFGTDKVHFLGPVNEERKWELLTRAIVVLCPSSMEGFGIVAVEAPLVRTPVLVSNSTALPELAGTSEAIISTYDPEAWATAVQKISANANYSERILQTQMANSAGFSQTAVISELIRTYTTLRKSNQDSSAC